uniref:BURP domain-containing protein n=1 Tax=Leersia perrieri TaxID=77586 RepID=A0A0D9VGV0_9ORYZ
MAEDFARRRRFSFRATSFLFVLLLASLSCCLHVLAFPGSEMKAAEASHRDIGLTKPAEDGEKQFADAAYPVKWPRTPTTVLASPMVPVQDQAAAVAGTRAPHQSDIHIQQGMLFLMRDLFPGTVLPEGTKLASRDVAGGMPPVPRFISKADAEAVCRSGTAHDGRGTGRPTGHVGPSRKIGSNGLAPIPLARDEREGAAASSLQGAAVFSLQGAAASSLQGAAVFSLQGAASGRRLSAAAGLLLVFFVAIATADVFGFQLARYINKEAKTAASPEKSLESTSNISLAAQEFSSVPYSHLETILGMFHILPGSKKASQVADTLRTCAELTSDLEPRACATSHEAVAPGGVARIGGAVVPCHPMPYPYRVFYCHRPSDAVAMRVELISAAGDVVDADAAAGALGLAGATVWDGRYFQLLNARRGEPICHYMPTAYVLWLVE